MRAESEVGVALLHAWQNATDVILIDTAQSGGAPGHDSSARPESGESGFVAFFPPLTHAFGVAEAVELARALNQLPPRVVLYGIEGRSFRTGETLSPGVAGAVDEVLKGVCDELVGFSMLSASMR